MAAPCPLWDSVLIRRSVPLHKRVRNYLHLFLASVGRIGILLILSYLGPSHYNSILSFLETPPCPCVLSLLLHSVHQFCLPSLLSPGLELSRPSVPGMLLLLPASHLHDVKKFFHDLSWRPIHCSKCYSNMIQSFMWPYLHFLPCTPAVSCIFHCFSSLLLASVIPFL